jgi:hypothetical protein
MKIIIFSIFQSLTTVLILMDNFSLRARTFVLYMDIIMLQFLLVLLNVFIAFENYLPS